MSNTYYPGADRTAQNFESKYPGSRMHTNALLLHTTEGFTWPAYAGGSMAPNMTILPNLAQRTVSIRQHFPADRSSRALENRPGGVETNTLNVFQIELIGTCDDTHKDTWSGKRAGVDYVYWPDAPDWLLAELAKVVRWLKAEYPAFQIVDGAPRGWPHYPRSPAIEKRARMTFTEWNACRGIVGHSLAPEQSHGDPGAFPIARLVDLALGHAIEPTPAPAPDPAPSAEPVAELTVRTMNLAAKAKAWQRTTWDDRLPHIKTALAAGKTAHTAGAAIIALQEAGSAAYLRDLKAQVFDPLGYLLAPGGTNWRYLIFDPRQVKRLASGSFSLGFPGKYAAWGLFQDLQSGKPVFVTSVHLIQGWASTDAERKREARQLLAKTDALNTTNAPVVHAGDFNSYRLVGDTVICPAGFTDALDIADQVTDSRPDTFNGRKGVTSPAAYPAHVPPQHDDHLYLSHGIDAVRWDQNLSHAASDHNTIAVRIRY